MNPYRELGVDPTASISEIEARYRLLMREYHPDFHQHAGPEGLAQAERRTRNLNGAMDRIRQDRASESDTPAWSWEPDGRHSRDDGDRPGADTGRQGPWAGENPFWRPPGEHGVGNDTRARDWSGNAIPTDEPVPCPFCRKPFRRLAGYEQHLRDVHRFRDGSPSAQRAPRARGFLAVIGSLRFIPAWLVMLVAIAFWIMLGFAWFLGVATFLALVLWTQTDRRFRNR